MTTGDKSGEGDKNKRGEDAITVDHELYVHHNDTSGNFTLATQKLNGDNYNEWKRSAEIFLGAKNKLGFVMGTCVRPDAASSLLGAWDRCNNLVISWILHSVEPDIRRSILYFATAAEIWKDLKERFAQSNIPRKFQEQQVMQFLMGLNDAYIPIRGNILMKSPLPSLSETYRLVVQEESQRECNSTFAVGLDSTALAANKSGSSKQPLSSGHSKWSNTTTNSQGVIFGVAPNGKRSKFFCTTCNVWGHSIERCYKANPNLRENKIVNSAQINVTENSTVAASGPAFNKEQMAQLTAMLAQHNLAPQNGSPADISSAFMAGSFHGETTGPW